MGKIWVIGLLSSAMGKSIVRQKRLAESVQLHGQVRQSWCQKKIRIENFLEIF